MKQFLLLISSASILFSCGGNNTDEIISDDIDTTSTQEKEWKLTPVTWDEIENNSLQVEVGDRFEVICHVGDIGTYVSMYETSMMVPFVERRNQAGGFELRLNMNIGSVKNEVHKLPEEFAPEDFKISCDDGTIVTRGDKVKITVRRDESYSGGISGEVIMIEAIKDTTFDTAVFASAVKLTSAMVNDTSIKSVYAFIEAKPELPSIILSYTSEILLDLKNSSVKEIPNLYLYVGEGASNMNDIPDNYTAKDLVIRDYNGIQIKQGAKIRFYGTWERYDFESSTPGRFYVEEIEEIK